MSYRVVNFEDEDAVECVPVKWIEKHNNEVRKNYMIGMLTK